MKFQKKIISIVLVLALSLFAMFSLASCGNSRDNESVEPVIDDTYADVRIIFLEYVVRYGSGTGNTEYIDVGYVSPDSNNLETVSIRVENVVFTQDNVAEIRSSENNGFVYRYLYINETTFLELLK